MPALALQYNYTILMVRFEFEWDSAKDSSNQKRHGISFQEAVAVFFDENALCMPDPNHSLGEDRFILLGTSSQIRILVVCHCYRRSGSVVRIISARKATPRERAIYEGAR